MISEQQDADRALAVLKIIWMAMLGSLAVYLVVGRLVAPGLASPLDAETLRLLRIVLYALGFIMLIAAGLVRRRILGAKNPAGAPVQAAPASLPQKYSGAVIASLAMSESIGIYGLVLFLLGKSAADLYVLVGVAAAAMFHFRPRKEELLELGR